MENVTIPFRPEDQDQAPVAPATSAQPIVTEKPQGLVSRAVPQSTAVAHTPTPVQNIPSEGEKAIAPIMNEIDQSTKAVLAGDTFAKDIEAQKAKEASSQAEIAKKQEEINKINDEVKNYKFDNDSIWDKSSTGQKIALLLGGIVSAASDSGAKAYRDNIQQTLDRDIQQQMQKYNSLKERGQAAQTHLGKLVERLGSEEAATLALRSQQLQLMDNRLKIARDNAQSKLVALNAAKQIDMIAIEKQKADTAMMAALRKTQGDIKNINIGPYKGYVGDDVTAREFRKKANAVASVNESLNFLENLTKQGSKISPENAAKAQTYLELVTQQSKDILGTGVLSDDEAKRVKEAIGDPTKLMSLTSSTLAKIKAYKSKLNSMVNTEAKSLGLYKDIGENK